MAKVKRTPAAAVPAPHEDRDELRNLRNLRESREQPQDSAPEELDGRRRRGNTSRARIVQAMMQLIRDGHVSPGAARVAELAGVSLRTVFRHFEEMDSIYREISESMQARVLPPFFRPYTGDTWPDRLAELVSRRIELYETILPFKIAADLRRHQSEYLAADYAQHLYLEKMSLEAVLPPGLVGDKTFIAALRAATCFQVWRVYRHDQRLTIRDARAAMERSINALLADNAGEIERERRGNV
jgi:AcrR family transcriptional regulator